jgi:hypothetical protein
VTARLDVPRAGIERALSRLYGPGTEIESIGPVASDRAAGELKQVGYGEPLLVRFRVGGDPRRLVFRTMGDNWYGHDRRSDRAALALLCADTYALFPRHVQSLEVGALSDDGDLVPLPQAAEFYLLTTFEEGSLYAADLRAIEKRGSATPLDLERVRALASYLAELHASPLDGPSQLYQRALRDLVGSGEGIAGIIDGYPSIGPVPEDRLRRIEERCVRWRYALRSRSHRLRRTHGDFHPYNILFRDGADFTLLDASRGGVGDPADDLAALAINYLFGGVVAPAAWEEGLAPLWNELFERYVTETGDRELAEVIAPFFAWRALVVASPVWYPGLEPAQRDALLSFAEAVLDAERFDVAMAGRFVPET